MSNFFATKVVDEWGTSYSLTIAGYTALVFLMLLFLLAACFISASHTSKKFFIKPLVFSSMAIALGTVTSFIKLFHLPMGGSITLLSMFFICLIGYWYGLRTGLMAAIAYGILQLICDPYIISLPQMLIDYLFAFGALGLSGIFTNSKNGLVKGYLAGVLGRYFFAFLSGVIFFGMYAADYGMAAPLYALIYNGIYLGTEAVITLVIIALPPVNKALIRIRSMAVEQ